MRRWMDDEHSEQYRSHQLRGVCGGTVQQRVHGGVRGVWGGIGDGHAVRCWRHVMRGLRSRAVQQRVQCAVHGMPCWEVCRGAWAVQLLRVWSWFRDGHDGWCRRCELHSVCSWAVQQCVDAGLRSVLSWVGDRYVWRIWCHGVHGMHGRAVQCSVDGGMWHVYSWIGDGHVDVSRCHHVHGVCGRAI